MTKSKFSLRNVVKIGVACLAVCIMFVACDKDNGNHVHSYSTTWSKDATQHWHECSCGERTDVANHIFSGDICSICGYNKSSGSNGQFTITGMPSWLISVVVMNRSTTVASQKDLLEWELSAPNFLLAVGTIEGSDGNGNGSTPLLTPDSKVWTGTGGYLVVIDRVGEEWRQLVVNFNNGKAEVAFSSFTEIPEGW